ncbi:MAG: hypothetical protein FJ272_03865, partial [Planctomycetes bacterium]|nr:hypothetical protein [Planctomycetota bacterium]
MGRPRILAWTVLAFGLVLGGTAMAAGAAAFAPVEVKEHSVVITERQKAYSITMGGTVDMDSATGQFGQGFRTAFQPHISLTIENTGRTPVVNPRIVTNDERRWWSVAEIA